jgi:hypothetical protein
VNSREIEVTCPCCSARLVVDVRTTQVMKTVRKEDAAGAAPATDPWAAAQDKVRDRTRSGTDKMDSALDYERGKTQRFDEFFKRATEKHTRKPDEPS